MNTVRRPRRRPRVRSFNWRTFGWLLRREAMRTLWFGHELDAWRDRQHRHIVLTTHPYNCLGCSLTRAEQIEEERRAR